MLLPMVAELELIVLVTRDYILLQLEAPPKLLDQAGWQNANVTHRQYNVGPCNSADAVVPKFRGLMFVGFWWPFLWLNYAASAIKDYLWIAQSQLAMVGL